MYLRTANLEGVPHHVVEVVMLVEGVHNGSNGPIFYPAAEIRRSVPLWNGRPLVIYHSESFAGDPTTWNRQKVGTVFNARFDGFHLIADAWVNSERALAVDPRLHQAIAARKTLEVSTGVAIDVAEGRGDFRGKSFIGVARDLIPDHLAILPDVVGACSVKDGCGFLRSAPSLSFA